jgi:hypothetical protein
MEADLLIAGEKGKQSVELNGWEAYSSEDEERHARTKQRRGDGHEDRP